MRSTCFVWRIYLPVFFACIFLVTPNSQAAPRPSDERYFMETYCMHVVGKMKGLRALVQAVANLRKELENIHAGLASLGVNLTVPKPCRPDLSASVNVDVGVDKLAACFEGLNFSIQLPDMSNLAQCLTSAIPSVNITLPNIDPDALLQCLTDVDFSLDIRALGANLSAIVRAVAELIQAIMNLDVKFLAKFDRNFFVAVDVLANLCKDSGIRQARQGAPVRARPK